MAWGKVSASILLLIGWPTEARKFPWSGKWYPEDNSTHSYWVASLFPLPVPPSYTFSVSVLEFPSLHPEVKQVTSAFLGCSHYFGWWEERVLSQLFSSCCSLLWKQLVTLGPVLPHWAIHCFSGRTRGAENESISLDWTEARNSHFLVQRGKPQAILTRLSLLAFLFLWSVLPYCLFLAGKNHKYKVFCCSLSVHEEKESAKVFQNKQKSIPLSKPKRDIDVQSRTLLTRCTLL